MLRKQNSKIMITLLSTSFLIGCSPLLESDLGVTQLRQQYTTHELTIHTVEFTSKTSVTNVGVSIFDYVSGEKIADEVVNDEGKVSIKGVKKDHPYEVVIYRILPSGEWMEQTREKIVYDQDEPTALIQTFNVNPKESLGVPIIKQYPELPNGCEITALTAILRYYGMNVDKVNLANEYLPKEPITTKANKRYGPDPTIAYAGDPSKKTGGYYVLPPPIVDVANQLLFEHNSEYRAMDLSNVSKSELINYVQSGVPVLTWVTIDLKTPRTKGHWIIEETQEKHLVYTNLHAVVLTGYHAGKVTVMNPLTGYETIEENIFFDSFYQLGSHAVVIL